MSKKYIMFPFMSGFLAGIYSVCLRPKYTDGNWYSNG